MAGLGAFDDGRQIAAHLVDRQAAQAVVGAEPDDQHLHVAIERPVEPAEAARRGVAGDAGVDHLEVQIRRRRSCAAAAREMLLVVTGPGRRPCCRPSTTTRGRSARLGSEVAARSGGAGCGGAARTPPDAVWTASADDRRLRAVLTAGAGDAASAAAPHANARPTRADAPGAVPGSGIAGHQSIMPLSDGVNHLVRVVATESLSEMTRNPVTARPLPLRSRYRVALRKYKPSPGIRERGRRQGSSLISGRAGRRAPTRPGIATPRIS